MRDAIQILAQFVVGYSLGVIVNLLRASVRHTHSPHDQVSAWKSDLSSAPAEAWSSQYPHLTERQ